LSAKQFVFLEDHESAMLPIWREAFTGLDWLRLRAKPVYYGLGVTHGDGSAVITVPGFLGSDLYLVEMNLWLRRIGYRAYRSRMGRNAECPDILVDRLLVTIEEAFAETGRKVHLVGHSLGGVLSRSACAIMPEFVASVTTLGSPFRGVRSHPTVLATSERVRRRIRERAETRPAHKPLQASCFTGACNCAFAQAAKSGVPEGIAQTAIYTKSDGIVDWKVCITGDPDIDVQVKGTHCGLAWNPDVYRIIADRLAECAEAAETAAETLSQPRARVKEPPARRFLAPDQAAS
jgi:pimeloyl-ACP methyl ester carboxylesterase